MSESTESNAGSQGYITDIPYLRTFSNDLSPTMLRLVAALNGFEVSSEASFDYLEIGSAQGDTLITLAAAYPKARFLGVDINVEHIAFAREFAARSGLDNVHFLEADFEQLPREEIPQFDFITLWGFLSWVSPEKRKATIDFAGAKLKKGGLLFGSYNAMPGWSAVAPLRRLLLDSAIGATGSLERARRGVSVAKLLCDANAKYFLDNPAARELLTTALNTGISYVAHEYFLSDWHPMYFEDLMREMAEGGLHYVGQLPLFRNYRDLVIPPSLRKLFDGVTDRIIFERLKDYAVNEFFRRDVFLKGACPRADEITDNYLDSTPFGTVVAEEQVRQKVKLPFYTLEFVGPIFEELIPLLAEQPCSVDELASHPRLSGHNKEEIRKAVLHLTIAGQTLPMQRTDPCLPPAPGGVFQPVHQHNRAIIEQPLTPEGFSILSCPVTGTGLSLSAVDVVCLRALAVEPQHREEWLRLMVAKQPVKLQVRGNAVADFEEQVGVLAQELRRFALHRVPKLVQLGILEQTNESRSA